MLGKVIKFAALVLFTSTGGAEPLWQDAAGVSVATTTWEAEDTLGDHYGDAVYGRLHYSADNFHLYGRRQRLRFRSRLEFGTSDTDDGTAFGGGGTDFSWGYGSRDYALSLEAGTLVRGFRGANPVDQQLSYAGLLFYLGHTGWARWGSSLALPPMDRQFIHLRSMYDNDTGRRGSAFGWELWKRINENLLLTFELESALVNATEGSGDKDFSQSLALGINWNM